MFSMSERFIQVPAENEDDLLYRWPSTDIPSYSRIIVDADAKALFLSNGKVIQTFGPGSHALKPGHGLFGDVLDRLSGGGLHSAQIIYVSTNERTGRTFGGSVDDLLDPESRLIVTLKSFGDYALKVVNAEKLVLNLTGNDAWDVKEENELNNWVSTLLLRALRIFISRSVKDGTYSVLGLAEHSNDIEAAVKVEVNSALEPYGLEVSKMGNFHVNLDPEDAKALKKISQAKVMTEVAGSYGAYVQGEALLGAAQGMANGGAIHPYYGVAHQPMGHPGMPTTPGAVTTGGRFCMECGGGLPASAKFCPACGTKAQ